CWGSCAGRLCGEWTPQACVTPPDGCVRGAVRVAPVNEDVIALSLKPNGEPAASSATATDVGDGEEITTRPRPLVPRSAWLRSAISCFNPASAPFPLRISSTEATEGVSMALPENRKRSPACVLRIPSIDFSCNSAVCWPTVCPEPVTIAPPLAAADFTCVAIWPNDVSAVLVVSMVVLMLVIVAEKADR